MVDNDQLWDAFSDDGDEDDEDDYIPCEQRTRKQCSESKHVYLSTGATASTPAADGSQQFPECVASSIAPGATPGANPYKIASVAYLVDKTELTVNEALCRYAGAIKTGDPDEQGIIAAGTVTKECNALYQVEAFGHADQENNNNENGHIGYKYLGTANEVYADSHAPSVNYKDDDNFDEDPEGTDNEGGKTWLRVTSQDMYIREKQGGNLGHYELLQADIDYMSAFAVAAYARKLSNNARYTPQNGGADPSAAYQADEGHVADATDLGDDRKDNRAALLDAIPGTCFSPGVSGSLLYSEGWGAAYFSLGILLVVAHLVWLAAAVMGESMEMVRFNAKRAMSFLGILVGLIGLCTCAPGCFPCLCRGPPANHCPCCFPPPDLLFFTYGSGQGGIINDDELRHFADAIASTGENNHQALTTTFLQRLSHGQMNAFDSDSFTNTATIQAAEALHFVYALPRAPRTCLRCR
jgi:hypothetical protein